MKKRVTLLVTGAILILGIGVALAAELQTKEESVPKNATGQNSDRAENEASSAKPIIDILLAEGEKGRLVLADVNLPENTVGYRGPSRSTDITGPCTGDLRKE